MLIIVVLDGDSCLGEVCEVLSREYIPSNIYNIIQYRLPILRYPFNIIQYRLSFNILQYPTLLTLDCSVPILRYVRIAGIGSTPPILGGLGRCKSLGLGMFAPSWAVGGKIL